ncbi:MAG: MarR family winged helix-turn-helix transcriptional regulator [Pseudomonadota bacterium]
MSDNASAIIADRIIHLAWQSHSSEDGRECELSGAQWAAVRFLARSNAISRKPSAFAEFHGTTRGTASQTLKSLESAGLAKREKDSRDGRSVRFSLTEAGDAIALNDPVQNLKDAVQSLPETQRQSLGQLIEQLTITLSEKSGHHCFGCCHDCVHFTPNGQTTDEGICRLDDQALPIEDPSALCVYFEPD